jgi:hypothetical protein
MQLQRDPTPKHFRQFNLRGCCMFNAWGMNWHLAAHGYVLPILHAAAQLQLCWEERSHNGSSSD